VTNPREQARQARLDLEELDQQIAEGEIDAAAGEKLRATYLREIEQATQLDVASPVVARSRMRLAIGAAVLLAGFAVTVAVLGGSVEDNPAGLLQGVAAGDTFDPGDYSDETLEAVVATYANDPVVADQLVFMRFALADRYFERNEFQRAFVHYEAILAASPPAELFAATMTRIAWITFVGNGEVELSLDVIDRAIEAVPGSTEALYVKAQILWCGASDAGAAVALFDQILGSSELDPATRSQVESDRSLAAGGMPCT
jgi:tetratricopeptide (TPR) repeat protein